MARFVYFCVPLFCTIYDGDESFTAEQRTKHYPMVLASMRWNGRLGFFGGHKPDDKSYEDFFDAEFTNELGIEHDTLQKAVYLVGNFEDNGDVIELWAIKYAGNWRNPGIVSNDYVFPNKILSEASGAARCPQDGSPVWLQLVEHPDGGGLQTIRNSNNTVRGFHQLLDLLVEWMRQKAPETASWSLV